MVQQGARIDLEPVPTSVSRARRFVRAVLLDWDLEDLIDPLMLLTSEVTTNAVLHARTPFAVVVALADDEVRIDVLDGSPVLPQRRIREATASTGRGVALVDRLSRDWGATPPAALQGFSKGVWFSVPVGGVDAAAWAGDWLQGL